MASFTSRGWPAGATVQAYLRDAFGSGSGSPVGAGGTANSAGQVVLSGLADATFYVATDGSRSVTFRTDDVPVSEGGGHLVNVADHGIVDDGLPGLPGSGTDQLAALQALIDSFPDRSANLAFPGKGTGHYRLSGQLVIGDSARLVGAGSMMVTQVQGASTITYRPRTVLDFSGQASHGVVTPLEAVAYRAQGATIENLTILGSGQANGKSGVLFRDNTLSTEALTKVGLGRVINCYIEFFATGVNFDATADSCKVLNTVVDNCGAGYIDGSSECEVSGSCFWQINTSPAVTISGSRGFFHDNELEPVNNVTAVYIPGDNNKVVANNIRDTGVGISVRGDGNAVVGNSMHGNVRSSGILVGALDGSASADSNTIVGNTITDWGALSGNPQAMRVFGPSKFNAIQGNTIRTPAAFGTQGIVFVNTAGGDPSDNAVSGNTVSGVAANQAYINVGARNVFAGNIPLGVARVYRTTNQTLTNNTSTAISFDAEKYDRNSLHDTAANQTRVLVQRAGIFRVTAGLEFVANATGQRLAYIRVNGDDTTGRLVQDSRDAPSGANPARIALTTEWEFAAGDYVELIAYQNSGANLDVVAAHNAPWLAIAPVA